MNTTEPKTEDKQEGGSSVDLPQYLLGEKEGMTQVFTDDGKVQPATIVSAGPVVVTQVKTTDKDGYPAYQLGYGHKTDKNLTKPQQGHMQKACDAVGRDDYFTTLCEYRLAEGAQPEAEVGDTISVSTFAVGDTVDVVGVSKGKGFQGVVKRHGFAGGPRAHGGQKSPERGPGSIGATGKKRVMKGTKMAGRAGGKQTTVKNLEIVHVDTESEKLYIKGGLPGPDGNLLEVTAASN